MRVAPAPAAWCRAGVIALLLALLLAGPASLQAAPEPSQDPAAQEAVFAGGCFWCLEHDLEVLPGVLDAVSGYSGGHLSHPTYHQVSAGGSGHQESVRVRFDPRRLSYPALLQQYWRNVDPLDGGGQFCDRGESYRPVIFTRGEAQARQAKASLKAVARQLGRPVAQIRVEIRPLERFWPAEAEHQNYAERNPARYGYYRWACGRDRRLRALWGA